MDLRKGPTDPPQEYEGGMAGKMAWKLKMTAIQKMSLTFKDDEFKDWGDVPVAVRGKEGHCSWCYDKTLHEQSLPGIMSVLYKCMGCNRQTQECSVKDCEDFATCPPKLL